MEKITIGVIMFFAIGFSACNNTTTEQDNLNKTQKINKMNNLISIVEIPTADFLRAIKFYQSILNVSIEEIEMDGTRMGVLPNEEGTVNLCLVKGNDYKPTTDGAVVYLNAGNDLQPMLDKVGQEWRTGNRTEN